MYADDFQLSFSFNHGMTAGVGTHQQIKLHSIAMWILRKVLKCHKKTFKKKEKCKLGVVPSDRYFLNLHKNNHR